MKNRCVIICAAPIIDNKYIRENVTSEDYVICADGGYITAQKAQIKIDIVIGDFDSTTEPENNISYIKLPTQKDDTDTFYAIKYAIIKGYKNFLLLGSVGGRLDHTYANYSVLKYISDNKLQGVIKNENTEIFYTDKKLTIENKKGKTLSIFPFGCEKCMITCRGFKYEITKHIIESNIPLAISNIITTDNSYIDIHSGGVLIMILDSI